MEFALKYMYRKLLNNKFTRLVWVGVILISLLSALTCSDNSVNSNDSNEDYLFIDIFIWSYATQIEGDCTILLAVEPSIFYTYDPINKSLEIQRGKPFPIDDDLQIVTGFTHIYAPLAGVFDAQITLFPSYYLPDQITSLTNIRAVDSLGTTVLMSVGFSSKSHHTIRLPTAIYLPPDSTFQMVFNTIEEGDTEGAEGDSCTWEYTDSLVITNYGLNPKSNISWQPIAGPD